MDFSIQNIYKVNKLIMDPTVYSPNKYTKLCGTTGLFVFLLKDILEWFGIITEKKVNAHKIFKLCEFSIDYLKDLLNKLN